MKLNPTITLSVLALMLSVNACKPKKSLQKSEGSVEITNIPLSTKEYKTNKDYFRATTSGKSPDMAASKKIAMLNAKSEMASSIQSTVKKVSEQYTNQVTVGNKMEFEAKFEELQREVVSQKMSDVRIAGEKILKQPDGSFEYWICLEMAKDAILNGIQNSDKNKLNYDKKKYEEIFNQEMQKLEGQ
ncbi:MAG: LPP20 family lipoprotein [Bacteroidia bacterium]|nr:LPP20 family lipoprotein [Bacteroidia bacterium]